MRRAILLFLKIYQKLFTLIGYGSCRYYPTCSEYTKWQFEKNTLGAAFWHSSVRILRCNQLFPGGFDYPVVKMNLKRKELCNSYANQNGFIVKFWLYPLGDDRYYLIKVFKRENIA
ncbi:MAG: membrane protein insertion efficiency factor YidD [Campylobacteraceae bacterium 4484_4]|nr:MAG: membrane protein insertion efficiency factor YidD [Campylobacteraceae bacterium 4484_4]